VFTRPVLSGADITPPAITALELQVASRHAIAAALKSAGAAFMDLPDGRITVSPDVANGTTLLFAE
jgi:hypothetical protein